MSRCGSSSCCSNSSCWPRILFARWASGVRRAGRRRRAGASRLPRRRRSRRTWTAPAPLRRPPEPSAQVAPQIPRRRPRRLAPGRATGSTCGAPRPTVGVIGPATSGKTLDVCPRRARRAGRSRAGGDQADDVLLTAGPRASRWPSSIHSPLPGLPPLAWDPLTAASTRPVATRRAKAFTAGTVLGAASDGGNDAVAGRTRRGSEVLQCYLHAAALTDARSTTCCPGWPIRWPATCPRRSAASIRTPSPTGRPAAPTHCANRPPHVATSNGCLAAQGDCPALPAQRGASCDRRRGPTRAERHDLPAGFDDRGAVSPLLTAVATTFDIAPPGTVRLLDDYSVPSRRFARVVWTARPGNASPPATARHGARDRQRHRGPGVLGVATKELTSWRRSSLRPGERCGRDRSASIVALRRVCRQAGRERSPTSRAGRDDGQPRNVLDAREIRPMALTPRTNAGSSGHLAATVRRLAA